MNFEQNESNFISPDEKNEKNTHENDQNELITPKNNHGMIAEQEDNEEKREIDPKGKI